MVLADLNQATLLARTSVYFKDSDTNSFSYLEVLSFAAARGDCTIAKIEASVAPIVLGRLLRALEEALEDAAAKTVQGLQKRPKTKRQEERQRGTNEATGEEAFNSSYHSTSKSTFSSTCNSRLSRHDSAPGSR